MRSAARTSDRVRSVARLAMGERRRGGGGVSSSPRRRDGKRRCAGANVRGADDLRPPIEPESAVNPPVLQRWALTGGRVWTPDLSGGHRALPDPDGYARVFSEGNFWHPGCRGVLRPSTGLPEPSG